MGKTTIATVRTDLTWGGKQASMIANQSEKKLKTFLKDLTGAEDVDIIDVSSWDDLDEDWDEE